MTQTSSDSLLARLAGGGNDMDAWSSLDATRPAHDEAVQAPTCDEWDEQEQKERDAKLDHLLSRIADLAGGNNMTIDEEGAFLPLEPDTLEEAQLSEGEVEALILKYLLAKGSATGRDCADQVRLPFKIVERLLTQQKAEQLVFLRDTAPMNDYFYQLSDKGRERAKRYAEHCTYFGAAPVSLRDYIQSVASQSLTAQHPSTEDLDRAFSDLLMNKRMLNRLGPAINSGRGLFLYGAPGNGKTSIAERITKSFGEYIWIPRAIGVDGEILRLFDPSNHEAAPDPPNTGLLDQRRLDKRWIRIRRPTIVVGGELTMNSLEVAFNRITGISESPLQLKSNCGTLVIDDFGRQRMSTDELLNRWIVPLEKRYDFLNLSNGKKIQVPFDQLIVFSTNLEPKDLVDEAFLRRIPYKIEVVDPSEDEYRELFKLMASKMQIVYDDKVVDYLLDTHYRTVNRNLRCCHPRDLLLQVRNFCRYRNVPPEMTKEYFDFAVENYFAVV
ncbi:MAG: AAA family ATPase [Planctomycetia bacterium]|nr:AAA family ATPase [Planctomycetia bacterium]